MQTLKFNRELYSKIALMKAAYNFTDSAYIHLDADENYYYVSITPKRNTTLLNEHEFVNEMLAQSIRHEVYLQTKNIRELLVARAVSTSMLDADMEEEDTLQTTPYSEDGILKDWFNKNDTESK